MQKQDDRPLLLRGPVHWQIYDVMVEDPIDSNAAIEKTRVLLTGVGGWSHERDYGEEHCTEPVAGQRTQAARRLETKHRQLEHTGTAPRWEDFACLGGRVRKRLLTTEPQPSHLSSRAKPRDLRFSGLSWKGRSRPQ